MASGISEQTSENPLIFNFKHFGEFQKVLIRPEINYLDPIFCSMQLKPHLNQIIIYKYTIKGYFQRRKFWRYLFSHPAPPDDEKINIFYLVTETKYQSINILIAVVFRANIFCIIIFDPRHAIIKISIC